MKPNRTTVNGVGTWNWSNMSNLQTPGLMNNPGNGIPSDQISGIEKKNYKVLTVSLASARTNTLFALQGTVLQMVEGRNTSTGDPESSARITLRFNEVNADAIPFVPGQAIGGIPFNRIYITNEAQADIEVTLLAVTDAPSNRVDVE